MRVSHETIHQSLFVQGRGALRKELARCLRTGRAQPWQRATSENTDRRLRQYFPKGTDLSVYDQARLEKALTA
jgi:IS30 family transposase